MLGGQVLLLLVGLAGTAGQGQEQDLDLGGRDTSVIAMSNRGDWAWPEMCPKGFYTSGVSFKVQPLRRCSRPAGGPCSHGDSVPSQVEPVGGPCSHGNLCSLTGRATPGCDGGQHGAQQDLAALLPRWGPQWWLHS